MKKIFYLICIIIIIMLLCIQFVIEYCSFSSPKLLYVLNNKSVPNFTIEGNNSILVGKVSENNCNNFDVYLKVNEKYKVDKNFDLDIIVDKSFSNNDITLIKYYQKSADDYYFNINYPKEYGELINYNDSEFVCKEGKLGDKIRNYCYVYIKNYDEKYAFYLDGKEYEVDL